MESSDIKIKIYVVCHKSTYVPHERSLYPIQVGSAKSAFRLDGMLYDDSGEDNISNLNQDYCELTALYWAWKNDNSDYVGLFHYRRFIALNTVALRKQLDWWKHYYRETALTDDFIRKIGFTGDESGIISSYDIIVPQCSDLNYRNVGSFYELYKGYQRELDHALNLLVKKYPEYESAIDKCKAGNKGYHSNMFIMKRNLFEEYCAWIFSILSQMERDKFTTNKKRLLGYIAEFLTGIFFVKKLEEGYRIKEFPCVFFKYTDGKHHKIYSFFNCLLSSIFRHVIPLGSKRESLLYAITDVLRGIKY